MPTVSFDVTHVLRLQFYCIHNSFFFIKFQLLSGHLLRLRLSSAYKDQNINMKEIADVRRIFVVHTEVSTPSHDTRPLTQQAFSAAVFFNFPKLFTSREV